MFLCLHAVLECSIILCNLMHVRVFNFNTVSINLVRDYAKFFNIYFFRSIFFLNFLFFLFIILCIRQITFHIVSILSIRIVPSGWNVLQWDLKFWNDTFLILWLHHCVVWYLKLGQIQKLTLLQCRAAHIQASLCISGMQQCYSSERAARRIPL